MLFTENQQFPTWASTCLQWQGKSSFKRQKPWTEAGSRWGRPSALTEIFHLQTPTTWAKPCFLRLSRLMVCQSFLEVNRKSFSIVSLNSSHTQVSAIEDAALLAPWYLSAASGDPWAYQDKKVSTSRFLGCHHNRPLLDIPSSPSLSFWVVRQSPQPSDPTHHQVVISWHFCSSLHLSVQDTGLHTW